MSTTTTEPSRAADTIDRWLDALDPDDPGAVEADGEYLREINSLSAGGAPEADLGRAVDTARECGWSWAPIAVVLGTTREDAVLRFG